MWVQVLALLLTSYVILSILLNLSTPQFPYLYNGINNRAYLRGHHEDYVN